MERNAKISITWLLCFWLTAGYTQQAITASGNDAFGTGGSVAWSVGQVAYITNAGIAGSSSQGVQQPSRSGGIGVPKPKPLTTLSVFPNPATTSFILQAPGYGQVKMSYQLFDMQGRLLQSKSIIGIQTILDISSLPPSSYLLNIVQEDKQLRSFTIIKK